MIVSIELWCFRNGITSIQAVVRTLFSCSVCVENYSLILKLIGIYKSYLEVQELVAVDCGTMLCSPASQLPQSNVYSVVLLKEHIRSVLHISGWWKYTHMCMHDGMMVVILCLYCTIQSEYTAKKGHVECVWECDSFE